MLLGQLVFHRQHQEPQSPEEPGSPNGGFASWRMAVILLWDQIIIQMNTRFA